MKKIKHFTAFILLFLYILQPQFIYFPFTGVIIFTLFLFLIVYYRKALLKIFNYYKIVFSILIILSAWSAFLSAIYAVNPIFSILMLKVIFYIIFSILYLKFISNDIHLLIKFILMVIVLNSLIVIFEFVIPNINQIIEEMLKQVGNIDFRTEGLRLRGLSAAGGAALSVASALGFVLTIYLKKIKSIGYIEMVIFTMIIIFSLLFIGRTGFLLISISIIYYLYFAKGELMKASIYAILFFYVVIIVFTNYYPERYNYFNNTVSAWALEFFIKTSEGKLTASNSDLLTMYHLPNNLFHLLIGYGYFDGKFTVLKRADPGYIKTITSVGFLGAFLFYGMVISLMIKTFRNKKETYLLLIPIYAMLLIAEVKEPFIYQQYAARILYFFLVIPYFATTKKSDNSLKGYFAK